MEYLIIAADSDQMEQERRKAKELRRSLWWKNRLGEGRCTYCGLRFHPRDLTMDHALPLIRGGRTSKSNCVPACRECNQRKENLSAEEWKALLQRQGENG